MRMTHYLPLTGIALLSSCDRSSVTATLSCEKYKIFETQTFFRNYRSFILFIPQICSVAHDWKHQMVCRPVSRTRMYFLFYYYNAIVSNAEYISPPKMQLNFSSLFFSNHKKMVTVGGW